MNRITFLIAITAAAALAGCESTGRAALEKPMPPIHEVEIPIAAACVPKDTPPKPTAYADDGMAQMSDPVERTKARAAANQQRRARLAVLEPIIEGCR
jgi:hypothetical protein